MESHEFEKLIADALSAEPLAGLERRVLARVSHRGANPDRGRRALWWSLPVACALAAAVFAVWLPTESGLAVPAPAAPPVVKVAVAKTAIRPTAPASVPVPAPVQDRGRLSPEEKALVAFVTRNPERAAALIDDLTARTASSVEIKPIEIPPLDSGGGK